MLNLFFYFVIFLFGLSVGSFLNSIIWRLYTGESFLSGHSYCPYCKHILDWSDLIPILSFLILRGKCRYCHQKISWQYPLVELATGIIFVSIFNIHNIITTCFLFLVSCFLIIIFVYDLKHYIIPDQIIYPAIGLAFLYQLFGIWNFGNWDLFRISDLGFGILPSLALLAIILLSHGRWMGFGDFKLAILIGLFLGWPNIVVALFLAFTIGAIIGIGLIVLGKKSLKSEVPFGPFLVSGTFIAMFFGQQLINWYQAFFWL